MIPLKKLADDVLQGLKTYDRDCPSHVDRGELLARELIKRFYDHPESDLSPISCSYVAGLELKVERLREKVLKLTSAIEKARTDYESAYEVCDYTQALVELFEVLS